MGWPFRATTVSRSEDEARKFAQDLIFEEYRTLRAEAHQSLAYAQAIVRWSIAIFGTVLAAALLAASRVSTTHGYSFFGTSVLVLFGFALPGVSWAAAWTWLGELIRMERAGSYLRGLEAQLAALPGVRDGVGTEPLRWERFIASPRRKGTLMGKQIAAYLGTAMLFFGASAISLGLFVAWWGTVFEWAWPWTAGGGSLVVWPVLAVVFELACIIVAFAMYRRLMRLGKHIESPIEV